MNLLEGQKKLAREHPQRRSMFMVRGGEDEPYQIMFNTTMKDTEPPVHRHKYNETFMVIEGVFDLSIFPRQEDGLLAEKVEVFSLLPGNSYEVPANTWHTFHCISESGVLMEFKNCYYQPETDKEMHGI